MRQYDLALQNIHSLSSANVLKMESLEFELVEKYAKLAIELHEFADAKTKLQSIRPNRRPLKLTKLLADVFEQLEAIKDVKNCHTMILRIQPCAIESASTLIKYGQPLDDVLSLIEQGQYNSWMKNYLIGQSLEREYKYSKAQSQYNILSKWFSPPHDYQMKLRIAHCQYTTGDLVAARSLYSHVRETDPYIVDHMDNYAELLQLNGKTILLNRLAMELMQVTENRAESWLALATYCETKGETEKALGFIEKAIYLNPRYANAHCMKGSLFLKMRRNDAVAAYRNAYMWSKDLKVLEGLVKAYLEAENNKEALLIANEARKLMPKDMRTLILQGRVWVKEPGSSVQAKRLFKQVLEQDPNCFEAIELLTDLHIRRGEFDDAIKLLQNYTIKNVSEVLHTLLGNVYLQKNDGENAVKHFNAALCIRPDYVPASEGLKRVTEMMEIRKNELEPEYDDDEDMY
ncbi:Anaphase-promoting complex subunit 7 [Nowakowskiella sp. JEL0407]|nr:Anaphase-promoting complex subunit 7 [Nowakowskiella sp. JEL0407]